MHIFKQMVSTFLNFDYFIELLTLFFRSKNGAYFEVDKNNTAKLWTIFSKNVFDRA